MSIISSVIPNLFSWTSHGTDLLVPDSCCLMIDPSCEADLTETGITLLEMFRTVTNKPRSITIGTEPAKGDIFLKLEQNIPEIGDQGYILEIDELIKIQARTSTGIFYGAQTVIQMLHEDSGHTRIPRGFIRDFPRFLQRGIMLDAGRKYWGMDYLYKTIRRMARLKLNVLHLHLSDWSAIRIQSDRFPRLASSQYYSKSQITSLVAYAKKMHVQIVPEIDLPAHATVFSSYDPSLAFTCDVMSKPHWPGGEFGGFTLDYSNLRVRQWIYSLLDEILPLFDTTYFHIGCDEVPSPEFPEQCQSLFDYSKAKGYPYPTDVLVEWINEMNAFVKKYKKKLQIWSWWERTPHSIVPDKDITIGVWVEAADPNPFLEVGYQVINSPEDLLYLTPGLDCIPDCDYLFNKWLPGVHQNLLGYKLCVWADKCETGADEYFESFLWKPRAVLAERTWNRNIPSGNLTSFLEKALKLSQVDDIQLDSIGHIVE